MSELKDLPGVVMFLDDVLVMGSTEAELMKREEALLERLSNLGFALNLANSKSRFGEREIRYLGFRVSGGGISPLPERVEALHNAPPPTNVTELKSFLGHLTFYDRFCKNRASVAAPLYELLKKQVPFVWGEAQQRAFQETKELLCSEAVLARYSLELPIPISCDSSLVGCGAVLYNIYPDGTMRPVMYVRLFLTASENGQFSNGTLQPASLQ